MGLLRRTFYFATVRERRKMRSLGAAPRIWSRCLRQYSIETLSASTAPPMLVKVRADMKAAMKAKDSAR